MQKPPSPHALLSPSACLHAPMFRHSFACLLPCRSYNTSAMTPLVPLWLSWMTDAARMTNRSHGLDFQVGAEQHPSRWLCSTQPAVVNLASTYGSHAN